MRVSLTALSLGLVAVVTLGCADHTSGEREFHDAWLVDEATLEIQPSTCNADHREAGVEEFSGRLVITVTVRGDTAAECLDGALEVELESPLADRRVIDGTRNEPVHVADWR